MAIELVHLCDAHFTLRDPVMVGDTPLGNRLIFEVEGGHLEGDRIKASLRAGAASGDWVTLDARGVGTLDVRATLETDDGAVVFTSYRGRTNIATGGTIYIAPLYDTGDERYLWLNSIQAVGKGKVEGNQLTYEIYELR
jgi:hypothetical protein